MRELIKFLAFPLLLNWEINSTAATQEKWIRFKWKCFLLMETETLSGTKSTFEKA